MSSILNNVSALGASRQLGITGTGLQKTIQRLTTGKRINRASDDAAGLGISNKLSADIRIAAQAKRNTNDGLSYLQTADGVLDEVTNLLTRASELAEQAKTGTISNANRTNINTEFQNILKTINDIGQSTTFNGAAIFSAMPLRISAGGFSPISVTTGTISTSTSDALGMSLAGSGPGTGPGAYASSGVAQMGLSINQAASTVPHILLLLAQPVAVDYNSGIFATIYTRMVNADLSTDMSLNIPAQAEMATFVAAHPTYQNGLAMQAALNYALANPTDKAGIIAAAQGPLSGASGSGDSLSTASGATNAASKIAAALNSVSSVRANLGASMQQLSAVSNALGIQVENFTSANSQIQDANIADEVVSLTKFQILNQSGTSALSKANQASQQVLALLQ